MDTPEYVNAYLNGMQFVLLALEGRIDEFDQDGREELHSFMDEYHELAMRMRERSRLGVNP